MAAQATTAGAPARQRLVAAAVASFAARGFHGTTTRDIASAAGMSPAALYVHYASKEELLHEISREGHERTLRIIEAAIGSSPDPATQLARLVEDFVRHHAVEHTTARIVNYELAALAPDHRAEIDRLRHRMDAAVRELVERGVAAGVFATDDARMSAGAVLSLGIDVARWYHEGLTRTPDEVAAHYRELALRMVAAITPC
ncbi:TetR/AcrR family transcriptional regulator [Nocardioides ferulae]|uniref:TetR/AcrR family transcriptional regulator n=1 Tax=Nocardioides ferulae TaxID=2340821 RepID=UPI000EAB5BDC|nr:TetR/AcrR family transcriptional regulator [Nocardioides ferulae]